MLEASMKSKSPPYPRFGECIVAIAGALDVKKQDSDVGRLAREGDFDWEKTDAVIQELLLGGSRSVVGSIADSLIAPWLSEVRESYARVVLDVPLDSVSRADVFPILEEEFFTLKAAQLLIDAHEQLNGPDLAQLLDGDRAPLSVTLEWLDTRVGSSVDKLLYPQSTGSDRTDKDKVSKWRNGIDVPSAPGIKLFCKRLLMIRGDEREAQSAALWIMLAAAMARFERALSRSVRPTILRHVLRGAADGQELQRRLLEEVRRVGKTWPELAEQGSKLWCALMRTTTKQTDDRERLWEAILQLESQAGFQDPEGRTNYHYEWMKARWSVLAGQYEDASQHYEKAFEMACYRAGSQISSIVEEASCIAAFLEKKVFLKQLKHVGITLGLFQKPREASVLEAWEVEQLAQQMPVLFPAQGRFVDCEHELAVPTSGVMAISEEEIAKIKLDLVKLDRVRAVHFASGDVRRWPQLRLFASFGIYDRVKALLNAGAPVDQLDSSGGSALLCALQHAVGTGKREVLDLLLASPHQAASLNATTNKKRLTPLMCAIDLGDPDVVQRLLDQGADPNQHALTDYQSPLYYAVSQLAGRIDPQRMFQWLTQAIFREPDLVQKDALRRFGVGLAGVFGDKQPAQADIDLALKVAKSQVDSHVRRHTVSKLTSIVALLLDARAKPNAPHNYPAPGRTALMLAAESDLLEVFALMVDHGGEPLRTDADGKDCMQIAMAFNAKKIESYLVRTRR